MAIMPITKLYFELICLISNFLNLVDSICLVSTCKQFWGLKKHIVETKSEFSKKCVPQLLQYIHDPRVNQTFREYVDGALYELRAGCPAWYDGHPISTYDFRKLHTSPDLYVRCLSYIYMEHWDWLPIVKNYSGDINNIINCLLEQIDDQNQINHLLMFTVKYCSKLIPKILKKGPTNLNEALILASNICHNDFWEDSNECEHHYYKGLDTVKLLVKAGANNFKKALSYCGCDALYEPLKNSGICKNRCDINWHYLAGVYIKKCKCTYKNIVKCDPFTCLCECNQIMRYLREQLKDDKYIAIY